LLKPFNEKRFSKAIARAIEAFQQKRAAQYRENILTAIQEIKSRYTKRFAVKDQRTVRFIDVGEIDWIESKDKYLLLHHGKQAHVMRGSLASIESGLDPEMFVRIHRSVIVNLSRIKEIQPLFYGVYRVILNDYTALRVSRSCLNRLKQALRTP
jgi:two-component system, LytTR family, response regulator